jgi:hypothetical protein
MRRSERARPSPVGGRRAALAGLALLLGGISVAGTPAEAQTVGDPFAAYGGFNAQARSGGVQLSYDVKGVLPLPPPLIEVTVPTSRASSSSGPTSVAFGSMAYPGDLVGNLPSLAEQSAPGTGALVPPYPLATLASFPTGPLANRQDVGTASAVVSTSAAGANAATSLAGTSVPGAVEVGNVVTTSVTGLENGLVVARSRTHVADVAVLFGILQLHDVVTDVVAASDGATASTAGSTTVGSAHLLGLPVTIGPTGLSVGPYAPPTGTGPLQPLIDPLRPVVGPLATLATSAGPLGAVLQAVVGRSTASIDDLLAAIGLHVAIAPVDGTHDGAQATVAGAGLEIRLQLDGSGQGPLSRLVGLIPSGQLPGMGLPGVPVNTSPQALVNLLKETHIARAALATATASVDASPAFVSGGAASAPPTGSTDGAPLLVAGSSPDLQAFTTPLPLLAGARPVVRSARGGGLIPGRAVEVALIVVAALTLPAWGAGSARLMDAALADRAPGCIGAPPGSIGPGGTRRARHPGSPTVSEPGSGP